MTSRYRFTITYGTRQSSFGPNTSESCNWVEKQKQIASWFWAAVADDWLYDFHHVISMSSYYIHLLCWLSDIYQAYTVTTTSIVPTTALAPIKQVDFQLQEWLPWRPSCVALMLTVQTPRPFADSYQYQEKPSRLPLHFYSDAYETVDDMMFRGFTFAFLFFSAW